MRILGWALFAVTCASFALQALFVSLSLQPLLSYAVLVEQVFPLFGLGAVIGAGVGALIVSRYPRNIVGWLLLVGQLGSALSIAAESFDQLVARGVIDAPLAGQITFCINQLFDPTFTAATLALIFMIVPDGRLLSRRWRVAVGIAVVSLVLHLAAINWSPWDDFAGNVAAKYRSTNVVLLLSGFFLMLLALALGAVALVLRLRRSTGQQRLQLRWISTSAAVLAATFVAYALSELFTSGWWVLAEATVLAYMLFSVSVGVAIMRYRLYDIDVILSRAIVLGVLAVFVTVGYIGVVVAIGSALGAIGAPGSSLYWPSLVATALVAAAFQPLRRHVMRLADQAVYGNRAAPYEALATLSRRLADSPAPDALPIRVAEATGRSVGATQVCVTLGGPGTGSPVPNAVWHQPGTEADPAITGARGATPELLFPVRDMAEQVGIIEVRMPAGRALRTFERHLLEDVAAQAGVAFRNALLETELAARVEEGEARSAELAESRRRLVGVEDEARERLAGAIRRAVVPHLAVVDTELRATGGTADEPEPVAPARAAYADKGGGGVPGVPAAQVAPAAPVVPAANADNGDGGVPGVPAAQMQQAGPVVPVVPVAPGLHIVPISTIARLISETELALEELRKVVRGVFPALLERRGLRPALTAQLDVTHPLAQLEVDDSADRRLDRAAEAAAYVFSTEVAPTDRRCVVRLRVDDGVLVVSVTGDGEPIRPGGSDDTGHGGATNGGAGNGGVGNGGGPDGVASDGGAGVANSSWQHARDRVAALDGEFVTTMGDAGMTEVTAYIPLPRDDDLEPVMAAQSSSSRSGPNSDLGT